MADGFGGISLPSIVQRIFLDVDSSKGLQKFDSQLGALSAKTDKAGRLLTKNLTLPIVAVDAIAVKMAVDFDKTMTQIITLAGQSRQQVNAWKKDLLELGPALGKSPQELAEALFFISSSGIKASEALNVLKASAKASALGLGETKVVADAVTSALNAYGSEALDAEKATAILVAAVRDGKGEADAIAGAIGRVIPIASELEVSFDQVAAAIASMTLQGLDANEAVTALRGVLGTLLNPSSQATKLLAQFGLTAEGLRQELAQRGLLATLGTLQTVFNGNADAAGVVFGNIRALTGVFNLTGKNAARVKEVFSDLASTTGKDLADAFSTVAETPSFKLQQALAELQATLVDLGAEIVPLVVAFAKGAGTLFHAFRDLPEPIKKAAVAMSGFLAVLGPGFFVISKLLKLAAPLKSFLGIFAATRAINPLANLTGALGPPLERQVGILGRFSQATKAAAADAGALGKGMSILGAIVSPTTLIIGGFVAAIAIATRTIDHGEKALERFTDAHENLVEAAARVEDAERKQARATGAVIEAQSRVREAQEALNDIRGDAKRDAGGLAIAERDLRDAERGLASAQKDAAKTQLLLNDLRSQHFGAQVKELEALRAAISGAAKVGFLDQLTNVFKGKFDLGDDVSIGIEKIVRKAREAGISFEELAQVIRDTPEAFREGRFDEVPFTMQEFIDKTREAFIQQEHLAASARELSRILGTRINIGSLTGADDARRQLDLVLGKASQFGVQGSAAADAVSGALAGTVRAFAATALAEAQASGKGADFANVGARIVAMLEELKRAQPGLADAIDKLITSLGFTPRELEDRFKGAAAELKAFQKLFRQPLKFGINPKQIADAELNLRRVAAAEQNNIDITTEGGRKVREALDQELGLRASRIAELLREGKVIRTVAEANQLLRDQLFGLQQRYPALAGAIQPYLDALNNQETNQTTVLDGLGEIPLAADTAGGAMGGAAAGADTLAGALGQVAEKAKPVSDALNPIGDALDALKDKTHVTTREILKTFTDFFRAQLKLGRNLAALAAAGAPKALLDQIVALGPAGAKVAEALVRGFQRGDKSVIALFRSVEAGTGALSDLDATFEDVNDQIARFPETKRLVIDMILDGRSLSDIRRSVDLFLRHRDLVIKMLKDGRSFAQIEAALRRLERTRSATIRARVELEQRRILFGSTVVPIRAVATGAFVRARHPRILEVGEGSDDEAVVPLAKARAALDAHAFRQFLELIRKLPRFHSGIARVPGPPGSEMLAILRAGEEIRAQPSQTTSHVDRRKTIQVNITNPRPQAAETSIERQLRNIVYLGVLDD